MKYFPGDIFACREDFKIKDPWDGSFIQFCVWDFVTLLTETKVNGYDICPLKISVLHKGEIVTIASIHNKNFESVLKVQFKKRKM